MGGASPRSGPTGTTTLARQVHLAQAQTVLAQVLEIGLEGRIDADTPTRGELDAKVTVWLTSETTPEQFAQLAQLCVEEEASALVGFEGYAELR